MVFPITMAIRPDLSLAAAIRAINECSLMVQVSSFFKTAGTFLLALIKNYSMDKSTNIPGSHAKDQDNIGYENTRRRNDSDEKEMDRIETTDTDKDEDAPVNVSFTKDSKTEDGNKKDDDE